MDTNSCRYLCKEEIRERAKECGFDVCGFAKAEPVDSMHIDMYNRWLEEGKHGELDYMEKYIDLVAIQQHFLMMQKPLYALQ